MSGRPANTRPAHDRSACLSDQENNNLIQLIERDNGVVSYFETIISYFS